jgi:hypothetical protein
MGADKRYLSPAEAAQIRAASTVANSAIASQKDFSPHQPSPIMDLSRYQVSASMVEEIDGDPFFFKEFMACFSDCLGVGGTLAASTAIDSEIDDREYQEFPHRGGYPYDFVDVDDTFRDELEHSRNLNAGDSWSCDSSINTGSGIFSVDSSRIRVVVDPRLKGASRPTGGLHLISEDDASVATLASDGSPSASSAGRSAKLPDFLNGAPPSSWSAVMAPSNDAPGAGDPHSHLLPSPYRRPAQGDIGPDPLNRNHHFNSSGRAGLTRGDRSCKTEGGKTNMWNAYPKPSINRQFDDHRIILGTHDETTKPHVLTISIMDALQEYLPYSKQGEGFWLKYSMVRDGANLRTVLDKTKRSSYTVLAVETLDGEVFGAFTAKPWHITWTYYGTPESFLWRLKKRRKGNPKRDVSQRDEGGIEIFRFAGNNQNVQLCHIDRMAVGGGSPDDESIVSDELSHVRMTEWGFGLAFDKDLQQGTSSPCVTFNSPSLSKKHADGSRFEVSNMEFWTITPCISVEEAKRMEKSKSMLGSSSASVASW